MKRALFLILALGFVACGNSDTKLRVTRLDRSTGDADGNQFLRVYGTGFLPGGTPRTAHIYFGGKPGNVERFQSDTEMIAIAPPGKPNETVDVTITFEPGGEITLPKAYTFIEKTDNSPNANSINWKKVK